MQIKKISESQNKQRQHRRSAAVPGVAILFTGRSRAGKSRASELLAQELGHSLYRVDMQKVVSKYIGETEKNLRRLFNAAERADALLIFEEAEDLFGKRTGAGDSHDRFANLEISYLLRQIEDFRGVAILSNNSRNQPGHPFLHRFRFVIHFPSGENE